jgi:hypothetical protein
MATLILDRFDGRPPKYIAIEDLPDDKLLRLGARGSEPAIRELARRLGGQRVRPVVGPGGRPYTRETGSRLAASQP